MRTVGLMFALAFAASAGGCADAKLDLAHSLTRPAEPPSYGTWPSERHIDRGKRSYRNGDYGLAEEAFRAAVEEEKDNPEAWLGLAASYDRLKRFDHAKRAYDVVMKLVGPTPTVLNNLGYHYYLTGNSETARETWAAAQKADPGNPVIQNNLNLFWDPAVREGERARL